MIIFHPNNSRLAMPPAHRSTLSDEPKKSGKKSRGRPNVLNFLYFCPAKPKVLKFQKIFEPIFETFRGPLISEVLLLIELSLKIKNRKKSKIIEKK